MELFNNIKSYILEEEFKATFINEKLNVINYDNIDHFDSNKIIIKYGSKNIVINGESLVVSKLLNKEILIEGKIVNIEFR